MPRPSKTPAFFQQLAEEYLVLAPGRTPVKAIAERRGVPAGTVTMWIRQARQQGFLPPSAPLTSSLEAKLRGKYRRDESSGCWVWTASLNSTGYGRLREHSTSRTLLAHRVSYELHVGPIPEGLVIDHLCRNRACINPDHLEPVTFAENVRRGDAVKTHCPKAHPYDATNTGKGHSGSKRCLSCHRAWQLAYYHRTKNGAV